MKKSLVLSLIISMFIVSNITIAASAEANAESIIYEGNEYSKASLSEETIDWVNWYNQLPEESKEMVSYVPDELTEQTATYSMEKAKMLEIKNFSDIEGEVLAMALVFLIKV